MGSNAKLLEDNGWTVECESPLEIRHVEGSFASGLAADLVLEALREKRASGTFEAGTIVKFNGFPVELLQEVDFYTATPLETLMDCVEGNHCESSC